MPDVRGQRRAAPASCTRLQSWQLPAHAGDARADQELVANEPEGETDQDRCEGRQPRPLRRIPNGRGRITAAVRAASGLVETRQQRKNPPRFGVHLGNPG